MSSAPPLWRIARPESVSSSPLIVNVPHAGTHLPQAIARMLAPAGLAVPDTDWHVDKLYDFVPAMGATLMVATHSRIVVDLNRDPSGDALYPGARNTEICPTATFAEEPIYLPGKDPDRAEIASRLEQYWQPYHRQLAAEIARAKAAHGFCILLDAHSIVSVAPRFFSGRLPDLNLGTVEGRSCASALADAAFQMLADTDGFSSVHNGRFKGGYITRHYGMPGSNAHALQLELAQCCYMDEVRPREYAEPRAAKLRAVLKALIELLLHWHPTVGTETKKWEHS